MRRLVYLIMALLVAGPLMAGEFRLLQQEDLQWGPMTTTASGSVTGTPLPRYFSTGAFTDNLTLYGNDLIVKTSPWVDVRAYKTGTSCDNVVVQAAVDNNVGNSVAIFVHPDCDDTGVNYGALLHMHSFSSLAWGNITDTENAITPSKLYHPDTYTFNRINAYDTINLYSGTDNTKRSLFAYGTGTPVDNTSQVIFRSSLTNNIMSFVSPKLYIGTTVPSEVYSTVTIGQSQAGTVSYSYLEADEQDMDVSKGQYYYIVHPGVSNVDFPLPEATTALGRVYTIKKGPVWPATVTITTQGSDTIDGADNVILSSSSEYITLWAGSLLGCDQGPNPGGECTPDQVGTWHIVGRSPVVIIDNVADPTASQSYGSTNLIQNDITVTLPTAVKGMSTCVMDNGTAHDIIVDVQSTDNIVLVGVEGAAGIGITNASGSSTGDYVCFVAAANNKWYAMHKQGTWASQ